MLFDKAVDLKIGCPVEKTFATEKTTHTHTNNKTKTVKLHRITKRFSE